MTAPLIQDLVVNGEVVPRPEIAAEAQNHVVPKGKPGLAWRNAADAVAIRALLLQEARRRGIESAPAEIGPGRHETEEEAQIRELLDQAVAGDPPSEEQVRAEWERDPTRFRAPPLWEASHILCAFDSRDEEAGRRARARADALASEAVREPGKFARLALEGSDCESAARGGSLGQIRPGDTVPEFEAALRALAERQITREPVATRHGWHVIKMDAVAEGDVLPYGAVRDRLAVAMEKASWSRAARKFVEGLVASAELSGTSLQRS